MRRQPPRHVPRPSKKVQLEGRQDGRTTDGVVDAVAVVPHKKIQKGDIFPQRLNNSGLG